MTLKLLTWDRPTFPSHGNLLSHGQACVLSSLLQRVNREFVRSVPSTFKPTFCAVWGRGLRKTNQNFSKNAMAAHLLLKITVCL